MSPAQSEPKGPVNGTDHPSRWRIDPEHSEIRFAIRHLMISTVRGRFSRFRGDLVYDDVRQRPAGVLVEVDAASIETGHTQRDLHLRSGDFFDVEGHPQILFASTHIEPIGGDQYKVDGDLRLRGETRPVVLDVNFEGTGEDPSGRMRASFTATTQIDRRDFGLTWNRPLEAGGVLVGDIVRIYLEIQAVQE